VSLRRSLTQQHSTRARRRAF